MSSRTNENIVFRFISTLEIQRILFQRMEIKAIVTKAGLIIGASIHFARAYCYARVEKLIFMRLCENMVLHWSLPYGVWNVGLAIEEIEGIGTKRFVR